QILGRHPGQTMQNPGGQSPHRWSRYLGQASKVVYRQMGSNVRQRYSCPANTAASPTDVSTAINICQNKTNEKFQRIEKLNLWKKTCK
ncbi:hypothetical protein, partial [Klebsiella pneumoniae]|uniref:hypothetical protein n=1 Tax=Klebsiella pneumoniae TaxID=573 RepID=UPI00358E6E4E